MDTTKSKLEKIVDRLDEKTTVEFYENLKTVDNVDILDIDKSDLASLKTEIKRALSVTPYEDVQRLAPKAIAEAINLDFGAFSNYDERFIS